MNLPRRLRYYKNILEATARKIPATVTNIVVANGFNPDGGVTASAIYQLLIALTAHQERCGVIPSSRSFLQRCSSCSGSFNWFRKKTFPA